MRKKAALELSIGTVVVIVIAITMLILGIIFVRNVMCGALGLTGDLNEKVKGEINKLFGSTGAEVQCIGSGGEPVKMIPGKLNIVYCGVKATEEATYKISLDAGSIANWAQDWIEGDGEWTGTVAPGDDIPKKIIRFNIPAEAPERTLNFQLTVEKEGTLISTQDLDFEISRTGFFRTAMC